MKKIGDVLRVVLLCFVSLCIPALLILNGMQAKRYTALQKDVRELELKQQELVEQNKKMITDISLLSSSDRIESIAENELGMRKAESEEIVRVEMKGSSK